MEFISEAEEMFEKFRLISTSDDSQTDRNLTNTDVADFQVKRFFRCEFSHKLMQNPDSEPTNVNKSR